MKIVNTRAVAVALASLLMVACERSEERDVVEPLSASQDADLVGYDPTTCNLVRSFGEGEFPRTVDMVEEDGAMMLVKTQRRGHNGKYLAETDGILLDPRHPDTDLVNMFDAQILGISGLLTVADESGQKANRSGGRVILDFSPVGAVTMKTMLITDISEEDKGSKIELFSASGQILDSKEIPVSGKNQSVFVSFANVPGVTKAIVTFGSERSNAGSGAIGRLQLCVDGQGIYDDARLGDLHSVWLQYVGTQPANVTVTANKTNTNEQVFSAKGMKPGTMFKVATREYGTIGKTLTITTNRKEKQIIAADRNPDESLNRQYGSFRVVEARCSGYPLRLQQ